MISQFEMPFLVTGMTCIYALVDPETNEIRYIGKSGRPKDRLSQHLNESIKGAATFKAKWIRKLISKGKTPVLLILEHVPEELWEKCERKWIARFKKAGVKLTNGTNGGDGVGKGFKVSEETRRKISIAHTGMKRPPSVGEKLSTRFKGIPLTTEACRKMSKAGIKRWKNLSPEAKAKSLSYLKREWTKEESMKRAEKLRGVKPSRQTSSRHLGVTWFKRDSNWRAYFMHAGKQVHVGYFATQDEAVAARLSAEASLHSKFAHKIAA